MAPSADNALAAASPTDEETTGAPPEGAEAPKKPDGRQLRRERNRDAVVEALLDLYRDGNLRPSTEEIATRSGLSPRSLFRYFDDVDDLARTAMQRQLSRARPLVEIAAEPDDPFDERISALVNQRFTLFGVVGNSAEVMRLRAPAQPILADELERNRKILRSQIRHLFAGELAAMEDGRARRAVAAADVLTAFESYRNLISHRAMSFEEASAVMTEALTAVLTSNN
jgi:AcrR family transcriptional regulator